MEEVSEEASAAVHGAAEAPEEEALAAAGNVKRQWSDSSALALNNK